MVTGKNKIIAKAEEKRKYLTGEAAKERIEELREKAEFDEATAYEAGKEEGKINGIHIGEKRGVKRGILETAKNMLKNNIDIAIIQKCTGLSLNEVKKL